MDGPSTSRDAAPTSPWPLLARAPRHRLVVLVAAIAAVMATAGIATIPFYTRGEPREALVVEAMLAGDGWALPLRNGEFPRKPPFFHWVAAGAGFTLGHVDELVVRLPSVLASVAAAVTVFAWAAPSLGSAGATLVTLITVSTFEWLRAASVARVDMMYTALLSLCLLGLDRLLRGTPRPGAWRWLLYAAAAAAVLTKGPIGFLLPGLAALVATWLLPGARLWQRVQPVKFAVVVAAIAGTWFLLAYREHGSAFLDIVLHENVNHLIDAEAGGAGHAHGVPYLLVMAAIGFLPWTPLLPLLVPACRRWRDEPSIALSGIWILTIFAVHALAAAKRGVYVLPSFPALAFLMVSGARLLSVADGRAGGGRWLAWSARGYAILAFTLGAVVLVLSSGGDVPAWLWNLLRPRDQAGTAAAIAALRTHSLQTAFVAIATFAAALVLVRTTRTCGWDRLVVTITIVVAMITVTFNGTVHPALARQQSLKTFMGSVVAIVDGEDPLFFLGSVDPGAAFYARRPIARVPLRATRIPGPYLLVWERDWWRLQTDGAPLEPLKVSTVELPGKGHLLLFRLSGGPGSVAPARPPY